MKEKVINWTSSKLQFSFSEDTTVKKMKSQATYRKKIFTKQMSNKGLVS